MERVEYLTDSRLGTAPRQILLPMTTAAASPSAGALQNSKGEQSKKARETGDDCELDPIKQRALRRASLEFGMFAVISHACLDFTSPFTQHDSTFTFSTR